TTVTAALRVKTEHRAKLSDSSKPSIRSAASTRERAAADWSVALGSAHTRQAAEADTSIHSVLCLCGAEMRRSVQPMPVGADLWECSSCLSWVSFRGTTPYGECWTVRPFIPQAPRRR